MYVLPVVRLSSDRRVGNIVIRSKDDNCAVPIYFIPRNPHASCYRSLQGLRDVALFERAGAARH